MASFGRSFAKGFTPFAPSIGAGLVTGIARRLSEPRPDEGLRRMGLKPTGDRLRDEALFNEAFDEQLSSRVQQGIATGAPRVAAGKQQLASAVAGKVRAGQLPEIQGTAARFIAPERTAQAQALRQLTSGAELTPAEGARLEGLLTKPQRAQFKAYKDRVKEQGVWQSIATTDAGSKKDTIWEKHSKTGELRDTGEINPFYKPTQRAYQGVLYTFDENDNVIKQVPYKNQRTGMYDDNFLKTLEKDTTAYIAAQEYADSLQQGYEDVVNDPAYNPLLASPEQKAGVDEYIKARQLAKKGGELLESRIKQVLPPGDLELLNEITLEAQKGPTDAEGRELRKPTPEEAAGAFAAIMQERQRDFEDQDIMRIALRSWSASQFGIPYYQTRQFQRDIREPENGEE